MLLKRLIKIFIVLGLVFPVHYFFIQKDKVIINQNDIDKLRPYDIILTSGQSFQSKILNLFNFSFRSYTHIGIIEKENDKIFVLHSTPDGTKENGIRFDEFQTFIDLSNVNHYKVLRLDSIPNLKLFAKIVENYKQNVLPFDYDFDNLNKEKIYCSELVYDILSQQGLIESRLDLKRAIHPREFTIMTELKTITERKSTSNFGYIK